ncbi:unnamed protein product [Allacma fusca]|uniref:Uncharacterized protein n=1 Tax=Allacma fusca TaxID=39272 RepID=A0A8J2KH30_9HEXA|nr:unnamed protein product [Allacma fusca]
MLRCQNYYGINTTITTRTELVINQGVDNYINFRSNRRTCPDLYNGTLVVLPWETYFLCYTCGFKQITSFATSPTTTKMTQDVVVLSKDVLETMTTEPSQCIE